MDNRTTERLIIREFVKDDAVRIPREEYGMEENVFRSPELMAHYIEKQYGFYEYGTWALEEKESGALVGMAGVSNPRLPKTWKKCSGGLRLGFLGLGFPGTGFLGLGFPGLGLPGLGFPGLHFPGVRIPDRTGWGRSNACPGWN